MWYKSKKVKKLALNLQLLTVQILTNDVQVLLLCLSYFVTTVKQDFQSRLRSRHTINKDDFLFDKKNTNCIFSSVSHRYKKSKTQNFKDIKLTLVVKDN